MRKGFEAVNCFLQKQKYFAQRRRAAESTKKTRELFISNLCAGKPEKL
jgi:hypothetical protein